jgi:phosphoserine phosphatase
VKAEDPVLQRLGQALLEFGPGVLAFDADGTLWSGDVGEDVFVSATAEGALRAAALPPLQRLAAEFGMQLLPEPNAQAQLLFEAYLGGKLPESLACEMMAWGFAGFAEQELARFVCSVLQRRRLESRRFMRLLPVFEWARAHGLRTLIVSASPDFVICEAIRAWNVSRQEIAACSPRRVAGMLSTELVSPLPYLDEKVHAVRALAPGAPLLAAFGDNGFDAPLLCAAHLPFAVRPKPALLAQLETIPRVVLIAE